MIAPRFPMTYCAQCGGETGPGNAGHSTCATHTPPEPVAWIDGDCIVSFGRMSYGFIDRRDRAIPDSWIPLYTTPQQAAAPEPAMQDVLTERKRQREVEGYTPAHDDSHERCELGNAAACYAIGSPVPGFWPQGWVFKDSGDGQLSEGHRRGLVKAGALILAEIERIDRAQHVALAINQAVLGCANRLTGYQELAIGRKN